MVRSRGALIAVAMLALVALSVARSRPQPAHGCAFTPRQPATYEAEQARRTYLNALDAAAVNGLLPGDPFFGLPPVERGLRGSRTEGAARVPVELLKAIAWVESDLTMAIRSVKFQTVGDALVSFDCGHGIMQVTTGMTAPLADDLLPSEAQVQVATHYGYNIARGAAILADKWNQAPQLRPIAGTTTGSDPGVIENWYYAVWSYNGFSGPGSSKSNHPLDPSVSGWPRPAYRCDGTQSRTRYPYQELVWGCLANPPSRNGALLWSPVAASLPDFTQAQFFQPMSLSRWVFPFSGMDIPTPQPAHVSIVPTPPPSIRSVVFAGPRLVASGRPVSVRVNGTPQEAEARIEIENGGSGLLSWQAVAEGDARQWLVLDPPAGVAAGGGLSCSSGACSGELAVTVNAQALPESRATGMIRITPINAEGGDIVIRVDVFADFEIGAPGTSRAD
jgi:hypothetical protein